MAVPDLNITSALQIREEPSSFAPQLPKSKLREAAASSGYGKAVPKTPQKVVEEVGVLDVPSGLDRLGRLALKSSLGVHHSTYVINPFV